MRRKLVQSIDLESQQILPIFDTVGGYNSYYSSLQTQLVNYFGQVITIYKVEPDGNCLYRALSHFIFGLENCFEILKHKLIETFISNLQHHFNVMNNSGIPSEQELHEHIDVVAARHAWGTNLQLSMLGALAGVDVLLTDCTDANSLNWNILPKLCTFGYSCKL